MTATTGAANAAVTLTATSVTSVYTSNVTTADLHKTNDPTKELDDVKVTPQIIKGSLKDGANAAVPVEFFAYCVDIFQSSGPTTFNVVSLADYLGGNATKLNRITALIAAEGASEGKLHDAAVQLAVWELINETLTTPDIDKYTTYTSEKYYDWWSHSWKYRQVATTPPQFWADGVKNGSGVLANTDSFLSAAVADAGKPTPGLNLYVAKSNTKQDFLFWTITPPAVPEPATWAMMLMGFGSIGYAMRAKRGKSVVSFA
ncbi:MAG: PEPxxWA-CTERM sorting domain-containing protein [Sphingobium sp.]|nr:PEPxxWA-CTERM sorting domain-containing protein [Sphingobium sp.]